MNLIVDSSFLATIVVSGLAGVTFLHLALSAPEELPRRHRVLDSDDALDRLRAQLRARGENV